MHGKSFPDLLLSIFSAIPLHKTDITASEEGNKAMIPTGFFQNRGTSTSGLPVSHQSWPTSENAAS
jgi:hypothetical protein